MQNVANTAKTAIAKMVLMERFAENAVDAAVSEVKFPVQDKSDFVSQMSSQSAMSAVTFGMSSEAQASA